MTTDNGNGLAASEIFSGATGSTFADIGALPRFFGGGECSPAAALTDDLTLPLPVVSSPMDTVTEWQTAVEIALGGGIGFIHMNLPIDRAVDHVARVKRSQMGIVTDPVCRQPDASASEVEAVKDQHGFSTLLITEDGTTASRLLGMVTKGHYALAEPGEKLADFMIPLDKLVTAPAARISSWSDAKQFLRQVPESHKVPILRPDGTVAGFFTRSDVVKMKNSPNAVIDADSGQLLVGAAVSTHEADRERIEALLAAGVDLLLIDSAQGANVYATEQIEFIRGRNGTIPIVAGNVVTPAQAEPLVQAGADILRVGMGIGSICTTQGVTGIGRAQLSAIYHIGAWLRRAHPNIRVVADGGIGSSGDMFKALACGASAVMLGQYLAGFDETPAEVVHLDGRRFKRYRGMGSPGALAVGGTRRYGAASVAAVAQGVEGLVPASGPLAPALVELSAQLAKSLEYVGCTSVAELHEKVATGVVRFEGRSAGAQTEGAVHGIHLV